MKFSNVNKVNEIQASLYYKTISKSCTNTNIPRCSHVSCEQFSFMMCIRCKLFAWTKYRKCVTWDNIVWILLKSIPMNKWFPSIMFQHFSHWMNFIRKVQLQHSDFKPNIKVIVSILLLSSKPLCQFWRWRYIYNKAFDGFWCS